MTDVPLGPEPAEHRRFARYLTALGTVAEPDEAELVAAVLRDEDPVMAQSAVVRHVDRRAAELLTDARFPAWCRALSGVVAGRDVLARRLREWTLLRALVLGEPWTPAELTTASDWCQRTAVTGTFAVSPAALALLAERGCTRRVRHTAARRPRHPG
ncbi:hypothetical protein [Streptomyces roseoviridis]|uniref:Uncharacterized protein n=1 Tax=Streptomyces roseoviridis TaxID=67361 RepID=A0ABV5QXJ2_9ACTN